MTGDETSHVRVSYKSGGAEITRIYAISQDLLTAPRPRAGKDLQKWLADQGCKLDCSDGPALRIRSADGSIVIEEYYRTGTLHRQDGPAHIQHHAGGSTYEAYYRDGKPHRDGAPATISRHTDGSTMEEF
jgi:hypothetical protein